MIAVRGMPFDNLIGIDKSRVPLDFRTPGEFLVDVLPLARRELLGIGQFKVFEIARQHHRGGHHGTRQRSAPCLIDPAYANNASRPCLALKMEKIPAFLLG
jgi:hypothetical protein